MIVPDKIKRERISPSEFGDIIKQTGITRTQFRDLFNRNYEFDGYLTGKQRNGNAHNQPTVAEMLVLDHITENPEDLEILIETAKSRMIG